MNANIVRQSFEIDVRKTLSILTFIDDYNYYMRDVDLVNQYRVAYKTYKLIRKS